MTQRQSCDHYNKTPLSPNTWFDLYPLACTTHVPPQIPNARLAARIDKVKETLEFVKRTIDIRSQIIALGETNWKYCTTCGRDPNASCCGLSCPLLRTTGWNQHKPLRLWMPKAKLDVSLYKDLADDICAHESMASKQLVQEWEVTVTDLLERTKETPNRYQHKLAIKSHYGFDKHWTFDEHWGKGPGLEAEVGPEQFEALARDEEETSSERLAKKVTSNSTLGIPHGFI